MGILELEQTVGEIKGTLTYFLQRYEQDMVEVKGDFLDCANGSGGWSTLSPRLRSLAHSLLSPFQSLQYWWRGH